MRCRIAIVLAVLMLVCGVVLRSSNAQGVQATVSDSAEGLQSQINGILESAKKNRSKKNQASKKLEDLTSDLRISENSAWFTSEFGDELGTTLATKYRQSWDAFQDTLARSFSGAAASKPKETLVTVFGPSSAFGPTNITSIEKSAKSNLTLYEVTVETGRAKEVMPGVYVYVDGGFRVLNWATLYQLPNVRPVRIRIGGNVQQAKLVHQVNPVFPPDARENHVQGVVVLHVVIDADGNVKQADIVSGPPEFAAAAQDAVKQWRYETTTLNGDPVEVDTTVSIVFTLGG